MLPLDTSAPPTTAADWQWAVAAALGRRLAGPPRVAVADDFATVDVDLSGCRLADETPPDFTIVGPTEPGPTVGRLHVRADPLIARGIAGAFDASADGVRLAVGRNAGGSCVATIGNATDGRLTVRLTAAAVDAALLAAAKSAAAAHGVDIRSVHATLTARSPRELDVALDVTAKKFVTFPLRITGRATVDDTLTAVVSGLTVDGSGMAATAAAAIIRPQLRKADGQSFPLASVDLGGVHLRDVAVDTADGLRLTATFGDRQ